MKKYLSILFVAVSLNCLSQSYSISPAKTVTLNATHFNVTTVDIYLNNISSSTLSLSWERVSVNVPAGWDYSICQSGTCLSGIPQGPFTMDPIPSGGQAFLGLNMDPAGISGYGEVKVYVYETGNKPAGDTLTWKITAPVGVEEITSATKGVEVYPNPASTNLNVMATGFTYGSISDALGRTVIALDLEDKNVIDVSMMPKGFYFLNLESSEKRLFKRIIIE